MFCMLIIIPYRNRSSHLTQFLKHYRRVLRDPEFLIVEQSEHKAFNRGKLLNIGVLLSSNDYFLLHDVDMLVQGPVDYSKPDEPTLLATNASQFKWQMPFPEYFGGVVAFTRQDFTDLNGYSNEFWGWGGEDNELRYRCLGMGYNIQYRPHRYFSLPHDKHPIGFDAKKMEQAKKPRQDDDGLLNTRYELIGEREVLGGRIVTVVL